MSHLHTKQAMDVFSDFVINNRYSRKDSDISTATIFVDTLNPKTVRVH